uniref:Uncharacterized protein n=1 Tax=Desulfovibrio sp. U5L TaxID=596152 RepID=I2PXI3_9BACT
MPRCARTPCVVPLFCPSSLFLLRGRHGPPPERRPVSAPKRPLRRRHGLSPAPLPHA